MPAPSAVAALAWSDSQFPCMGSTARVLTAGGPSDLPARARARLEALEARWSRFRPASELCRINASDGRPVLVSRDTFEVVALAVDLWHATDGHFDPTVLDALEWVGYDRSFETIGEGPERSSGVAARGPGASVGCADVELLPLIPAVRLPPGARIDLGGIGKGRAADLVAAELLAAGAVGVCVNLGGDVRVAGRSPEPAGWKVELDAAIATGRAFVLGDGAVATSTRLRRAWTRGGAPRHHLVDPRTGRSAWTGLAAVTVLASRAATAEVLAKAAFVAGPDAGAALLRAHDVTGLLVADDGRVTELDGLAAFVP